ncbi:MAG: sodium/glutamate symporter [Acidimicrobiia bacterium]|nr:sodium/glutamate symporter [Acidimicrobiia bacterium]
MNVTLWKLTPIQVLAMACFGLVIGNWLKRRLPVLDRLNIPASILGGFVYALAALVMRDRYLNLELDMVLRDVLMVAFFTTVGMQASIRLVKEGGRNLVIFVGASLAGLMIQIIAGVSIAKAYGLNLMIGLIPGAVSLTGGPATAIAFGGTFEKLGVTGATTIGIASAVFGITSSGLIGGYVGGYLIRKHNLKPAPKPELPVPMQITPTGGAGIMSSIILLAVAMGLGTLVSGWIQDQGIILPSYIGAMIIAGVFRNFDDYFRWFNINQETMDGIGNVTLDIFIVMALLTLRLWELLNLAVPILTILFTQIVLLVLLCWFFIYQLMGRDYEAAIMSTGYLGFMLGTVANAMACMGELVQKFGAAPRAFFIVSIVGAFLIDFINALLITQSINLLR